MVHEIGTSRYSLLGEITGNIYENDVVMSAIETNSKHVGKLFPEHRRDSKDGIYTSFPSTHLKKILRRPNEMMSMSVLLNKLATQYFIKNNGFALIKWDKSGEVESIEVISYEMVEYFKIREEGHTFYYLRFTDKEGKTNVYPYNEVIHIRRNINNNDTLGNSGDNAIKNVSKVIEVGDKSIETQVKTSNSPKLLAKFPNTMHMEDRDKAVDRLSDKYLKEGNQIIPSDPGLEIEPLNIKSAVPHAPHMQNAKERVYSYFGVSDKIVQSNYTSEEWNSYYSGTIEPIALQLSEEFTEKLLTDKEKDEGQSIQFGTNRIANASIQEKQRLVDSLTPIGALSINDNRKLFGYPEIEGEEGNKRLQSLNYVGSSIADEYQLMKMTGKGGGKKDE